MTEVGQIGRKLRSAARMSGADRALIAEAVAALIVARWHSGVTPFRSLARRLGGAQPPVATPTTTPLAPVEAALVRRVRWAVAAAAPWLPFRTVCLQQALAARAMLKKRGIASVLHLGIDATEAKLAAHAWLDAGGQQVTGYPVDPRLREVARFT